MIEAKCRPIFFYRAVKTLRRRVRLGWLGSHILWCEPSLPVSSRETLRKRKHGGFSRGVSVSIDLAGNRSLGEDEGECLRLRLWSCPLFNSQSAGPLRMVRPSPTPLADTVCLPEALRTQGKWRPSETGAKAFSNPKEQAAEVYAQIENLASRYKIFKAN